MPNETNSAISSLPGFGTNFGNTEARLALAIAAAGVGGGGGGGGITQAEVQAAMTAALAAQSQAEFSDTLLEDANGAIFISSKTIDEETGAVSFSTRTLTNSPFTPVAPISLPSNKNYQIISTQYKAIAAGASFNIDDQLTKVDVINTKTNSITSSIWKNDTAGTVINVAPLANQVTSIAGQTGGQISNISNKIDNMLDNWHTIRKTALILQPSIDWSAGDIGENVLSSRADNPGLIGIGSWDNLTTKAINVLPPDFFIWIDEIDQGCTATRLVNSAASTQLIKNDGAYLDSIYIDNLAAGIIYLQLFSGLSSAPAANTVPLESYRCPSNGSVSFKFSKVYSGQLWLAISSTPGIFIPSANPKNLVIRYL